MESDCLRHKWWHKLWFHWLTDWLIDLLQACHPPAEPREFPGGVHQRTRWLHCHHSVQQPHLSHWWHQVVQVPKRHLHPWGWNPDHFSGLLQVNLVQSVQFWWLLTLKSTNPFRFSYSFILCSKNYGITIKEQDQPLLMHRPKERSKPRGKVTYFQRCPLHDSVSLHCLRKIALAL